jgi:hypothetical protein
MTGRNTAYRLQTTMTPAQEAIVVYLRKTLLLPVDDPGSSPGQALLAVTREFQLRCSSSLTPAVSRSGRDRCLRRHGVGCRRDLLQPVEKAPHKSFFSARSPVFPWLANNRSGKVQVLRQSRHVGFPKISSNRYSS